MFSTSRNKGFSLIELLLVIGIFALLGSVSSSVYGTFKLHSNLITAVNGTVEAIRLAQSSAQTGKGDSEWGVKILSNSVVVFKGASFSARDTALDDTLSFSKDVGSSGLSEIVFNKVFGTTATVGTITLTTSAESKNITINERGTITY